MPPRARLQMKTLKTFYSPDCLLRKQRAELNGGALLPPHENPKRAKIVLAAARELGDAVAPADFGMSPLRRIHAADYLNFLQNIWGEWQAAGFGGDVMAANWPARGMRQLPPQEPEGKAGYYALAAETGICANTWRAARAAANCALAAARAVAGGERAAFGLCRPPGHHAAKNLYGGYCFVNNAAVAAQWLRDNFCERVAVLDVDFHHGNGTQSIFYNRADVLFASIHGDPAFCFPHFLGRADEAGAGKGKGANFNYPLPPATGFAAWRGALAAALAQTQKFKAEALVVSLGVDAYKKDPLGFFKLSTKDFAAMGKDIAAVGLPAVFVLEGGYAAEALGKNVAAALRGFMQAAGK